MTIKEASEKWGSGSRRVNTLCNEGRINGASKIADVWVLPVDAEKPRDERN